LGSCPDFADGTFSGYIIVWALLNPDKTPQDHEKIPFG
jgi:hypothetical protein